MMLATGLAVILVGTLGVTGSSEVFRPGTYRIPSGIIRKNPNPKWVSVAWVPEADQPFRSTRFATSAAMLDMVTVDSEGVWSSKARRAFSAWLQDCQNPVKLYSVTACLGTARALDPTFSKSKDFGKMIGYVNIGWDILREPPPSYEFARLGYIFNAGDTDFHKYGDLPQRLLSKDPGDRSVVVALVNEFTRRKPLPDLDARVFQALETAAKDRRWRPWDDYYWALAYQSYGRKHRKREAYLTAIQKAQSAIGKTPSGWDSTWIKDWIRKITLESQDPNFGLPPKFQYVDDIDP